MSKIISFPGTEAPGDNTAEDADSGLHKCLELATQRDLGEIFIIGRKRDGDIWFSSNEGDVGNLLFLIETAKAIILKESLGG